MAVQVQLLEVAVAEWMLIEGAEYRPQALSSPLLVWPSRGASCVQCMGGLAVWFDGEGRQLGTLGSKRDRVLGVVPTEIGYAVLLSSRLVYISSCDGGTIFDKVLDVEHGAFGTASLSYRDGLFWLATMDDVVLKISCVAMSGEQVAEHAFSDVEYSNVTALPLAGARQLLVLLDDGPGSATERVLESGAMKPVSSLEEATVVSCWHDSQRDLLLFHDSSGIRMLELGQDQSEGLAPGRLALADLGEGILCRGPSGGFELLERNTLLLGQVRPEGGARALRAALDYYGNVGSNPFTGEVGVVGADGAVRIVRLKRCA